MDTDQLMCFAKTQECPDKVTDVSGAWLMLLTLGFSFLVACGLASTAYHPGMTLKDTADSKGLAACQNHVPGKEMEGKQRGTTLGIRKLDRRGHLLPLPPSSWAAVIAGQFLQVHLCSVCPPLVFPGFLGSTGGDAGSPLAVQNSRVAQSPAGGRRSVLTFWCASTSKDGKGHLVVEAGERTQRASDLEG